MKKYAAKDPFESSTYGKGIDKVGIQSDKNRHGSAGSDAHIQANDVKSIAGWDKPLSKRLTF